MIWEAEIFANDSDSEFRRVTEEYTLLTGLSVVPAMERTSRGYLLEGDVSTESIERLLAELLYDPLVERGLVRSLLETTGHDMENRVTVLLKPGVMDPAALSVIDAARDLEIPLQSVRTFRRYYFSRRPAMDSDPALRRTLANDAIEQIAHGSLTLDHLSLGSSYEFRLITVPLRGLTDDQLADVSRRGQLSLNAAEMGTIQEFFEDLGRDPTDVELETIAQTWSEHCSHKTLKGRIEFSWTDEHGKATGAPTYYDNLLKQTIFAATQEIRRKLGPDDWCVSVFEDNAGVVKFDDKYHVCFKVETHNHPSAIEPYGGANTGLGGVIRDPLGTALGAKPVCNTDVFCFAPPKCDKLPPGVLHPSKVMKGVVAGVRDYGNRMGIPTVAGAVCFDDRYLANPLVFCGTVGLIPVDRAMKEVRAGDLIVVVGGRTGRDGIHGATFSSVQLTAETDAVSGGAVQIGNAITEKKLLDVILQARDRGLYRAITDCGAGGFSSAIGEMGEKLGATVHLERAPLKYAGLSYTEIWISESQERMILAVPPEWWPALEALCRSEDVEATVLGTFEDSGRLRLYYDGQQVANLDMKFLHHGRPALLRKATWTAARSPQVTAAENTNPRPEFSAILLKILSSYNVCSKETIIRQYDHEVQGGSVLKPLVGIAQDGPGDAAVVAPVLGSHIGLAIGCGINPHYGAIDPYAMAAAAVDEAVRNVVAVGADPARIALLDNFCWGNTERPEVLGSLVRAAQACHDVAVAFGMPFISGKDSLNNEYHSEEHHLIIPPTLLVSALGRINDVRRCVSMDLKKPGSHLILIGPTRNEMGGSHYHLTQGIHRGKAPTVDLQLARQIFQRVHDAITKGLVRACHDLSEGGLAVAAAEMAFAGNIGADITNLKAIIPEGAEDVALFSETPSRFLVEVSEKDLASFRDCLHDVPQFHIGVTCAQPRFRVAGSDGEWVVWLPLSELKEAWQAPLRW